MNSLEVEKAEAPTDKHHTATIPLFKNILIDRLCYWKWVIQSKMIRKVVNKQQTRDGMGWDAFRWFGVRTNGPLMYFYSTWQLRSAMRREPKNHGVIDGR
jgi:hypothetical protein